MLTTRPCHQHIGSIAANYKATLKFRQHLSAVTQSAADCLGSGQTIDSSYFMLLLCLASTSPTSLLLCGGKRRCFVIQGHRMKLHELLPWLEAEHQAVLEVLAKIRVLVEHSSSNITSSSTTL